MHSKIYFHEVYISTIQLNEVHIRISYIATNIYLTIVY